MFLILDLGKCFFWCYENRQLLIVSYTCNGSRDDPTPSCIHVAMLLYLVRKCATFGQFLETMPFSDDLGSFLGWLCDLSFAG